MSKIELRNAAAFDAYMHGKGQAPETRKGKIQSVNKFLVWLSQQNIPELQAGYNDVLDYIKTYRNKGVKVRTQQMQVEAIKTYYAYLISEKLIKQNPCTGIEIKGARRKVLYHNFSPEELETLYKKYVHYLSTITTGLGTHATTRRDKTMAGLIFFQGLQNDELEKLTIHHLDLPQGKLTVPAGRRTNERTLKLEPHQLYDLMEYTNETRKGILYFTGKKTDQLFLTFGSGERFSNLTHKLLKQLKQLEPKLQNLKHIRSSIISNWLSIHDTRKAQYMAGHRYVSSTESHKANNIEGLIEEVNKYHPDL